MLGLARNCKQTSVVGRRQKPPPAGKEFTVNTATICRAESEYWLELRVEQDETAAQSTLLVKFM